MKDMKTLSKRIEHELELRTLEITASTKWVDMKLLYKNLIRYKIVICQINENILSENVTKMKYKDWIRKIICRCQGEASRVNIPPMLIIKSDRLNRCHYPDQIDQLACVECDDSLSQDQLEQLVESVDRFYRNYWDDFVVLKDDVMEE